MAAPTLAASIPTSAIAGLLAPRVESILKSAVGGELRAASFRTGMEAACHCQCHCEGGGHSQTHSQSGGGYPQPDGIAEFVANQSIH
jgi:hypothetical protein